MVSDFQADDIILAPTGSLFLLERDRYNGELRAVPFMPLAAEQRVPAGAVLLCRTKGGRRLPVTDLGAGGLYAVETIPDPPEYDREADLDPGAA